MATNHAIGRAKADEGLVRGAYDWAVGMSTRSGSLVTVTLVPSEQAGVWLILAREHAIVDGKPGPLRRQTKAHFPTASYQTLAGALLAILMILDVEPEQQTF